MVSETEIYNVPCIFCNKKYRIGHNASSFTCGECFHKRFCYSCERYHDMKDPPHHCHDCEIDMSCFSQERGCYTINM